MTATYPSPVINPIQVGNLSFNTNYPLNLTTLTFSTTNYADGNYTTPYSTPTNGYALPFNGGFMNNVSEANGSTTINPPITLSQAVSFSSNGNNPITFTSSSSLITVTQSSSGFTQAALLSFNTLNNGVSTPNIFLGNSPQSVTITASQTGNQIANVELTINPIIFDIAGPGINFYEVKSTSQPFGGWNPNTVDTVTLYPPGPSNLNGIPYLESVTEISNTWFVPFTPFVQSTSPPTVSITPQPSSLFTFLYNPYTGSPNQWDLRFNTSDYQTILEEPSYTISTTVNANPGYVFPVTSQSNDYYIFSNSTGNGYTTVDILYTFPNQDITNYVQNPNGSNGW